MSTPIRRALYGKLSGDTTLNALLGASAAGYSKSIYHDEAPQDAGFPYVTMSKSAGNPTEAFTDPSAFENSVWMIKAVDHNTSADTAEAIADRLNTLLNDATLSISGGSLMYLRRQSDVEYPEVVEGESYRHCGALYRLLWQ